MTTKTREINLNPDYDLQKTFGVLACVDEEERRRIINLPFGKSMPAIAALEAEIELTKFKTELFDALHKAGGVKKNAAPLIYMSVGGMGLKIQRHGLTDEVNALIANIKAGAK